MRRAQAFAAAMELTPDLRRRDRRDQGAAGVSAAEWAAWAGPGAKTAAPAAGESLHADRRERLAGGAAQRGLGRFVAGSFAVHLCLLATFVLMSPRQPDDQGAHEIPVELVLEQPAQKAADKGAPPPPGQKSGQAKPPEAKPPESKAGQKAEVKPPEIKPPESGQEQAKQEQARQEQARQEQQAKQEQAKQEQAKQEQARQEEAKAQQKPPPVEPKPPEAKPPQEKPQAKAAVNEAKPKPAEPKPAEPKPAEPKQVEGKPPAAMAQAKAAKPTHPAAKSEADPGARPLGKFAASLAADAAAGRAGGMRLPFDNGPEIFRAVAVPLPTEGGDEQMSYKLIVFGLLERAKQYPPDARERGARGAAVVGFSIDDEGALTGVSMLRSSGDSELDVESLALVARAAPFPKPPPDAQREFAAEITFGIGDGE